MKNNIFDDIWFGKIGESHLGEYTDSATKQLLKILAELQEGNFEQISELTKISQISQDSDIRRSALRLFLSAASHDDIPLLGNMLDETSEAVVNDFCYFAESSLSPQILPYLLAMFETWEGTDIGEQICQTIGYVINSLPAQDGYCSQDELVNECKQFLNTHDQKKYFYAGSEFFVGTLTKEMISEMMLCKSKSKPYFSNQLPSILSISTGIKCPLQAGIQITDIVVEKVMHYVKALSEKKWIPGRKYFYGNLIGN